MTIIYKNMDLDVLELRIGKELENCLIWGDLNISRDEYDKLNNKMVNYVNKEDDIKRGLIQFIQKYPKLTVTFIVNYTLYEYDGNNFWIPLGNKFNIIIDPIIQGKIGKEILKIFKRHGFDVWEDDGLKYITPIICQSGIPTPCFDEIFDILEGTTNDFDFSPFDFLSDINGRKYYKLEKGAERFFRLYPEKAADLINSIRTMILTFEDNMSLDEAIEIYSDLSSRIVEKYADWLYQENNRNFTRKNKLHYSPPRLFYIDGKGVSIYLPEQSIRDDYIYNLTWKIFYNDDSVPNLLKTCPVLMDNKYSYIYSSFVTIDTAYKYKVELCNDNNETIHTWEIYGNNEETCLIFDINGKNLKTDFISFNSSSIIILNDKTNITDFNNINLIPIGLPGKWSKFDAYTAIPTDHNGYLCLNLSGFEKRIPVKYSYNIKLISNGNLFREEYSGDKVPVYTHWPILQIGEVDDVISDINNWQIRCKFITTGEKVTGYINDIGITAINYIDVDKLAINFNNAYSGKYEIKIYEGKNFKKSFLFYRAPYIESSDVLIKDWPSKFSNLEQTGFMVVENTEDYELSFNTNVKIEKCMEKKKIWNQITTNDSSTIITGTLTIKENSSIIKIPFQKTVRKMKWIFWNELDNEEINCRGTQTFYLDDFEKSKWWLIIHMRGTIDDNCKFELVLETLNREMLQLVEFKFNQSGNFSISMNIFSTTIENRITPFYLMLHCIDKCKDEEKWICLSSIKERIVFKNIKYKTVDNEKSAILWDKTDKLLPEKLQIKSLTNPNIIKIISVREMKTNKSNRQFVVFNEQLEPGIYTINPYDIEDDFLLDIPDLGYKLFEYNIEKVIRVNASSFSVVAAKTLYDWLVLIIICIDNEENLSLIERNFARKCNEIDVNGNFDMAAKLIFSVLINIRSNNFPQNNQKVLAHICEIIIEKILGNEERGKLITVMLKCDITQEDYEILIKDLCLYRFSIKDENLSSDEIRHLWDIDKFIASLWILKNNSFDSDNLDRLINIVGIEFIKDVLIFKTKNYEELNWNKSFRDFIQGKEVNFNSYFRESINIWGDTQEFINMFDFGNSLKSKIVLNNNKLHSMEKIFAGSKYIDLLIEWFRNIDGDEDISTDIKSATNIAYDIEVLYSTIDENSTIIDNFESVISKRKINENYRYLMCYYSAYYSLLEAFYNESEKYEIISIKGNKFFRIVNNVFPNLNKRDILMAEVCALLIKRRGAILCQ